MRSATISRRLRGWLATLGERCEYCRTSAWVTGIPLEADHILPSSQGGETSESNLCRACSTCNTNKGDRTWAVDPMTGQRTSLSNPRQQRWTEHFVWSADGAQIMGLTAYGRATVEALSMNNSRIVRARRLWVATGWHPPVE